MGDTFEESVFKVFEQLKGFNNRLSDFNKQQKDVIKDI